MVHLLNNAFEVISILYTVMTPLMQLDCADMFLGAPTF